MKHNTKDMTIGNPLKLIFMFALPLMAGNIFQQLYTMVDTAIVGNGVGVEALASLGAADWLNWMMLGTAIGFSQGFAIMISQAFGAKDEKKVNQAVMLSFALAIALSIFLSVISLSLLKPILQLMKTPDNVIGGSMTYLRIMFSGLIVVMMYNLFAAILRSFGDSKTPLMAMVLGSLTNIFLDLVFVYAFHWGIAGAAIATIIAQALAALFCLRQIWHLPMLVLKKSEWQWDSAIALHLLKLGIPVAGQNLIIALGGLILQSVVNERGFIFIAGYTATNKLFGLLEFAAISYGYAVSTYVGQNLGAKQYERIKQGVKTALKLSIVTSAVVSLVMIFGGKSILSLFISSDASQKTEVLTVAYLYLWIMAVFLVLLFLLHLYRSALQGMGNTFMPMVSGVVELGMRIIVVFTLPKIMGDTGIFMAEIAAWFGATALLAIVYYKEIRKVLRNGKVIDSNA